MAKKQTVPALIPKEKQPYPVPGNWRWVKLETVCSGFQYGYTAKATYKNCGPHFIRISDIGNGIINEQSAPFCEISKEDYSKYQIKKDDILIARMGSVGENGLAINDIDGVFASYLIRLKPRILTLFVLDYLQSDVYWEQITDNAKGSTRLNVNANVLRKLKFPLPPFPEQQRIVDRIESLFSKLDAARDKAQAVVDGYEQRRAAILHKAFTGELTEKWRKSQKVSKNEWRKKLIGEFSFVTKLAGFEYTNNIAPNLTDRGIPLFKGKNVQQGQLILDFESYIPKEVSDELKRSKLDRKCLLTPYVGTIGNVAIFDGSFEAHLGSNVGKIEINSDTFEEYLLYYLRSDFGYSELIKHKKATAQESISIRAIRDVSVILPSLEEQIEIVKILDSIFVNEEVVKSSAETVLENIDIMKKAILGRAFRGQLGTNNPAEESAARLLKQI